MPDIANIMATSIVANVFMSFSIIALMELAALDAALWALIVCQMQQLYIQRYASALTADTKRRHWC
jgi:hypothetical protein